MIPHRLRPPVCTPKWSLTARSTMRTPTPCPRRCRAALPTLTPTQTAALQQLRSAGKPLEVRKLARIARCGTGPVEALITKGVARRVLRRVDRFAEESEETATAEGPITLNADQQRA